MITVKDHIHLKGSKPHQPVQAIVVGRDNTGPSVYAARLTMKFNLSPLNIITIWSQSSVIGALNNHLSAFLSDAVIEMYTIVSLVVFH